VRARLRSVGLGGLFAAASCGFDSSGSGSGASLSVGDEDGGPSGEAVGDDVADDATADGSGDDVVDDGSSGPPIDGCEEGGGGSCGAAAPPGWTGPFALSSASPPDASLVCPQGWMPQAMGGRDLQAPAATCGCACTPGGGSCTVSVAYYSDASCTGAVESGSSGGGCDSMATGSGHGYAIASGQPAGMSCTPAPTTAVPPSSWATGVVLCAPPATTACDDGPCLPAPPTGFDGRWCVMAEGEQGCPAGAYSEATIGYRNSVDSRACSPCTCDAPSAVVCGSLEVFFDAICLAPAGSIPADGACHEAPWDGTDDYWAVQYDGTPPTYSCGGVGVSPIGEAAPSEPFTMCCTP
jgi:hypothetical protein